MFNKHAKQTVRCMGGSSLHILNLFVYKMAEHSGSSSLFSNDDMTS